MVDCGMLRDTRYDVTEAFRRFDKSTLYVAEPERSAWPANMIGTLPQLEYAETALSRTLAASGEMSE